MYTILGSPATRAFRVVWALEELSQPYTVNSVKPHEGDIKAVNPAGKVPALLEGDHCILDSTAIIQYLSDKHAQLTYPAGTVERAHQDSFTQFALDDIDGIIWTAAKHGFVIPEPLRAEVAVKEACRWDLARGLRALEERLGSHEFVMGSTFTVPDIILGHCAGWAQRAGFEIPEGSLQDYFERLQSRPAFIKALKLREAALNSSN